MKLKPSDGQLGVAFHNLHEFELKQLSKTANSLNFKIMQQASDPLNILICGDSQISALILLALARGATIVRPAYIYECAKQNVILKPEDFEVTYFPSASIRIKQRGCSLKDIRFSIDAFPGSNSHPVLSDANLENLLQELEGTLVKHNTYADFIVSDKDCKHAHSTVYKKLDYRWLYDSLLAGSLRDLGSYFF